MNPLQLRTVRAVLGEARESYGAGCESPTGRRLKSNLVHGVDVGFAPVRGEDGKQKVLKVSGLRPAVESLRRILTRVREENPALWAELGHCGMLCCRRVRGGSEPSRHSWGCAIDLTFGGRVDPPGDGLCQRGLMEVYRYFREEGWYWGAVFSREDAMHFEVSNQQFKRWVREGLIRG